MAETPALYTIATEKILLATILNSPYIETIRAARDVVAYNFSYDSVMRYINSGMFEKYSDIYVIDNGETYSTLSWGALDSVGTITTNLRGRYSFDFDDYDLFGETL